LFANGLVVVSAAGVPPRHESIVVAVAYPVPSTVRLPLLARVDEELTVQLRSGETA
jgi:hypothetical protein